MKIINAEWEQQNLGVKTFEIVIDVEDSPDFVQEELSKLKGDYIVVKMSSNIAGVMEVIQKCGFTYIEDMIHVEHDLHEVQRNRVIQRLYNETSFRKMTEDDIKQLFGEVEDGMFDSDRISNDSFFGPSYAAKRYCNWLRDLQKKDALFFVIRYRNDNTGFVVLQTLDGINYHSILGGGYKKYRNTGMGIIQKEQEITKSLGGKKVVTSVSSNNVKQLKALITNGYVPYGVDHIFVRHAM